jgi:hypothetical protein
MSNNNMVNFEIPKNCEICGKKMSHYIVLELSFKTGLYYKKGECPPDESQGCFFVGTDCARHELKKSKVGYK